MFDRILRIAAVTGICSILASCGWFGATESQVTASEPRLPSLSAGKAAFYVRVDPGQSLQAIARTYRVPKGDIIAANQLRAPYQLKPGMLLEIPLTNATTRVTVKTRKHIELASAAHLSKKRDRATRYAKLRQQKNKRLLQARVREPQGSSYTR